MKNIYLIRHARQDSALCNVNVKLSQAGHRQAEILANRMKTYSIEALYSSTLIRAVQTAEILNEKLRVPHHIREGIEEINFGSLTGKTEQYIKEHFGDFKKARWTMEEDLPYPEGENGKDVWARAMPVMEEIVHSPYHNIVVVTHGGTIRSLVAGMLGMEQSNKLLISVELENGSITHITHDEAMNRFYLERLNDYAHLENEPLLLRSAWK